MSIKKHKIYFPIYFTAHAQLYIVIRNWPVNCNQVTVSATLLTPPSRSFSGKPTREFKRLYSATSVTLSYDIMICIILFYARLMKFNVANCHSMRVIKHPSPKQIIHDYSLHNQVLETFLLQNI